MFLVLLGPPGAGKGTQADLLAETWGLAHIASGDLFREVMREGGELGQEIREYYDRGELVPDELTIEMFLERLSRQDCARGAILDGFPRNREQAEALDKALDTRGLSIGAVAHIRVADEEILSRLGGRWTCRSCGTIYHERHNPPAKRGRCDQCGGELYQRSDDQPETVGRRLVVYTEQTAPLIEYYRSQGKLLEVDGHGDAESVNEALVEVLEPLLTRAGLSRGSSAAARRGIE